MNYDEIEAQVLKEAASKAFKEEYQKDQRLPKHKFSKNYKKKMKLLLFGNQPMNRRLQNQGFSLKKRIIVILVMILVMVCAISCKQIIQLLYRIYSDSIEIFTPVKTVGGKEDFKVYELKELGDGYQISFSNTDHKTKNDIIYENDTGKAIFFSQTKGIDAGKITSAPGQELETVSENIYFITDGEMNTIIYLYNDYIITICAGLPKEDLIRLIDFIE